MSSKLATIVISERSILAEGVVATLKKGGYDVIQHVAEPSDIKLVHTRDLLVVLLREGVVDQVGTCQKLSNIREACPHSQIVLVRREYVSLAPEKAFLSEADAFIFGVSNGEELLASIEMVLSSPSKLFIASSAGNRVASETKSFDQKPENKREEHQVFVLDRLSQREREILDALAKGNSNKHLARIFGLSEATVKAHVRSIFTKLGARNRTTAALHLVSSGELTQRS